MARLIATWSGGKDSCLAMHKMIQSGHQIVCLVNTISEDYHRVRFHGVHFKYIQLQATSIGIPLLQAATRADNYTDDFIEVVRSAKKYEADGIVFGDIHLLNCYGWASMIARECGLDFYEPIWKHDEKKLLNDLILDGFESVVVSTQADKLDKSWVGRDVNEEFANDIFRNNLIDPCGENGEYHTFVTNGPIFNRSIKIVKSRKVLRDNYWFLDIQSGILL